jgi:hypothetical protein
MKKPKTKHSDTVQAMLPAYDLRGKKGVRGKYYQGSQQGHAVRVHEEDGTVATQYFTRAEGAVMLEPDIREYFSNSEKVNKTLRSRNALIPDNKTQSPNKVRCGNETGRVILALFHSLCFFLPSPLRRGGGVRSLTASTPRLHSPAPPSRHIAP